MISKTAGGGWKRDVLSRTYESPRPCLLPLSCRCALVFVFGEISGPVVLNRDSEIYRADLVGFSYFLGEKTQGNSTQHFHQLIDDDMKRQIRLKMAWSSASKVTTVNKSANILAHASNPVWHEAINSPDTAGLLLITFPYCKNSGNIFRSL